MQRTIDIRDIRFGPEKHQGRARSHIRDRVRDFRRSTRDTGKFSKFWPLAQMQGEIAY